MMGGRIEEPRAGGDFPATDQDASGLEAAVDLGLEIEAQGLRGHGAEVRVLAHGVAHDQLVHARAQAGEEFLEDLLEHDEALAAMQVWPALRSARARPWARPFPGPRPEGR